MTFASVSAALEQLFGAVPGVRTVQRGDQTRLGARGSLKPEPDQTPLVRITGSPEQERPWTHSGTYDRRTPYVVELWDYADDPNLSADAFADLAETLRRRLRATPTLNGLADTPTTQVVTVNVAPVRAGVAGPRPLSVAAGRAVLHQRFQVVVREAVH